MGAMTKNTDDREFSRLMHRAYIRDGQTLHSGEALLLACLLHAKGKSRVSGDMDEVQRIMRDRNRKQK
jgi:hypothetical protein